GAPVNSGASEMNAALSPDELSLYFVSTRAGGVGGADIWVSRRASPDAPWGDPVNLGPNVNGPGIDASPALSLDGHFLFFSGDRRRPRIGSSRWPRGISVLQARRWVGRE